MLDDLFNDDVWLDLVRSSEPLQSTVVMDEITSSLIAPFDYESSGVEQFYPYAIPEGLPKDFGIGVIVGASGSGKSTLLKHFGDAVRHEWNDGSIVSNFVDANDASEKLSAAGLMSIPDWVKEPS